MYVRAQQVVPVLEVDDDLRRGVCRKLIAVEATPASYRHGCLHFRALEPDFVISGFCILPVMGEMRAVTLLVQSSLIFLYRHEEDVAKVVAARSAQVSVAESVDIFVGIMISRAAVPVAGHRPGVRTQLDHAERPGCTREGMAVEVGPYKGGDILCVVRRRRGCETCEQQYGKDGCPFHNHLIVRVLLWHRRDG